MITLATLRQVSSVADIQREEWDRLANPASAAYDPFLSYDFFLALEQSQSATRYSGWAPLHLLAEAADGSLLGILPLYAKSHSQGEYVFDQGWARGLMMAGGQYYPKLLSAVPFTPVTGRRFLVGAAAGALTPEQADVIRLLVSGVMGYMNQHDISSFHINFIEADLIPLLSSLDLLIRHDTQFHFEDQGYGDFEGFLATLQSRKRKAIRRERRQALESGIEVEWVEGRDITEQHWDSFFEFYLDTGERKWGTPYLTEAFFTQIGKSRPDDILLIMAREGGRYIAGALNFKGSDTLYGRYWGASEHRPFLHFEICYYQAIDYALAHGLRRVEAGAQGEHKLLRGYTPCRTNSAHFIAHPGLRRAVVDYLDEETQYKDIHEEVMREHLPFKKTNET
ncbi:MAG: hypothetical protein DHS20C08_03740 [Rhodomicrobium sp.]|nr:MAG: hypothetical protein DHS20C08_03740 [Rhodomicrobium sp.]